MSKFKLSFPLIIFVLFIIVLFCCFSGKSFMEGFSGTCSGASDCSQYNNTSQANCTKYTGCTWTLT